MCIPAPDREAGKRFDSRKISRCDLEDIENFFADALQSRPFAKHLLQILWIREVKFAMGTLRDEDIFDFIHGAFALYDIDIDDETAEYEFFELLDQEYLQETNTGFSLTPTGKRIAGNLFNAARGIFSFNVESSSIVVEEGEIEKVSEAIVVALNKRLPQIVKAVNKTTKSGKPRKRGKSKYEEAVKDYLDSLVKEAKEDPSRYILARVENLSASDIAEHLKKRDSRFSKATVKSIEDRTGRTEAWKNREETLKEIYDTKTLNNPLPRNEPLPNSVHVVKKPSKKKFVQ